MRLPEKIVFTDGVFDLLHANHLAFLKEARAVGDRLIVGVISDRRVREYKRQPIIAQDERLQIVQCLTCVDHAFLLDDALVPQTMENLIAEHAITTVVYAGDNTPDFYVGGAGEDDCPGALGQGRTDRRAEDAQDRHQRQSERDVENEA
ncbi:MAG: adenylyltransferase/cytidyltransferase family protein [Alphaproteobacteria bacterium]